MTRTLLFIKALAFTNHHHLFHMGNKTHHNIITVFAVCQQNIHIFYSILQKYIREIIEK